MTLQELNQLQWIRKEIAYYEQQLCFMQSQFCCSHITKEEIAQMQSMLELAKQRCWIEKNTLEMFVDTVMDCRLRFIMRLRFINGYTWQKIAVEIGVGDESIPRNKVESFLKNRKEVGA